MIHVEVWSDILCPFCYIGKRHLEAALKEFEHGDQVKVVWRSFQLDPSAERNPKESGYALLARKYGRSVEWAKQMSDQMTERSAEVGLNFDLANAVPTNSFDAHRLIHLAKKHGLQDQMEERLFSAYLCEGKHIGDRIILHELGIEVGLDSQEVMGVLDTDQYADDVREEGKAAQSMGATGVPFFVMNQKYAVSGAQPVEVFVKALKATWNDREVKPVNLSGNEGDVCGDDGCELH